MSHRALGRQFGFTVNAAGAGGYSEMEEAESKVFDTLGTSKAPLDILQGTNISVQKYGMQPGHAGEYDHALSQLRIHPEVIDHEQGLLHELGHRHSAVMGMPHAAYDTPERRAAEEHYAEEFARRTAHR